MNSIPEEKIRECTRLFISTDRHRRNSCDRMFSKYGIHHSQHMLLMHLAKSRNHNPSQKDIANMFDISPAAIAVTLKRLEHNGYIKRKTAKNDSRYNEIFITDTGTNIVNDSAKSFDTIDRQMYKYLSEEDIDNLIVYLEKIQKAIKELNQEESE